MANIKAILLNNVTIGELLFTAHLTKDVISKEVIEELRELYYDFDKINTKCNYNRFTSSSKVYGDSLPRLQFLLKNLYKCKNQTVESFFEQYGGLLKVLTRFKTIDIMDDCNWKPLPITNFVYKLVSPYPCVINLSTNKTHRYCRCYTDIIRLWSVNVTTRQTSDGFTYRFDEDDNVMERIVSSIICKIIVFEHRKK